MISARQKPEAVEGYANIKLYNRSLDTLRDMALMSKKVFGKRLFMNAIADAAIQEYYDQHFKGKEK